MIPAARGAFGMMRGVELVIPTLTTEDCSSDHFARKTPLTSLSCRR
jgi:hypothetical protein